MERGNERIKQGKEKEVQDYAFSFSIEHSSRNVQQIDRVEWREG